MVIQHGYKISKSSQKPIAIQAIISLCSNAVHHSKGKISRKLVRSGKDSVGLERSIYIMKLQ